MVWVVWRQHRAQVLLTVGALVLLTVYVLVRGMDAFPVLSWLPLAPLLVGMFWGAPVLAKELERGTHRLAWTQSVSRRRWLVAKLGWLGLAVTVLGLALGVMVSAWTTAHDINRFRDFALFSGTGIAVGAWWLFTFLLGVTSGALLRRLLPALALTVAVFFVVLFMFSQVRGSYAEPLRVVSDDGSVVGGTFITGSAWLSPSGEEVDAPPMCAGPDSCVEDAGYRTVFYYQPADRYWRFQWTETGILLLGAVLLAGPVMYRVLRRPV